MKVKIEDVRVGDVVQGREVVEVLHRDHCGFVRLVLRGGWPVVEGYRGKLLEVERKGA